MFKKFDEKESVSGITQLKSSVQKGIRRTILDTYPTLEQEHLDEFMPKKDTYRVVKCHEHLEILVNAAGTLLFFKHRDGTWIPTLRLLQQYPYMLVPQKVDKGAIKFVLSGANIMCPGLTHPNAKMTSAEKGTVVSVFAEGKEHPLAIGCTSMSTADIASKNKGIGIETYHYLNDGLWNMKPVKQ